MKFIKKNVSRVMLFVFGLFLPIVSFAQTGGNSSTSTGGNSGCNPAAGQICNPLGTTKTIPELIKIILEGALKIGMPIVALAIIYCGFLFVSARGNSEKITKAKEALLYTLIGAAILLGAWAIAQMIESTITSLGS